MSTATPLALLAGSVLFASPQESDRSRVAEKQPQCVPASSAPLAGHLYPLGPEFHIAPNGDVGIGTMSPSGTLQTTASPSGPPVGAIGTFNTPSITSAPVPIYGYDQEIDQHDRDRPRRPRDHVASDFERRRSHAARNAPARPNGRSTTERRW